MIACTARSFPGISDHVVPVVVMNMAENEGILQNLKNVNDSLTKVVHMLQETRGEASRTTTSGSTPSSSSPTTQEQLPSCSFTTSLFEEQRRLFGNAAGRGRVNQIAAAMRFRPLSSGITQSTVSSGKKRARSSLGRRSAGRCEYQAKRSQWTHKFCSLADKNALKIPSVEEKLQLRAAGLGEQEITLDKGWSAGLLHEKLTAVYPKLRDGGGYEFLRTDGRSTSRLVLIPGSKVEGYSVQYLKDNLNQATAYIRPLQNDLSLEPLEGDACIDADIPMEECKRCGLFYSMNDLKEHLLECNQRSQKTETDMPTKIAGSIGPSRPSVSHKSAMDTLQELFPEHEVTALSDILQRCGGGVAKAVDMVFSEVSPVDVCTVPEDLIDLTAANDVIYTVTSPHEQESNNELKEDSMVKPSVHQLLKHQKEICLRDGIQRIKIARRTLWEDTVALLKSSKFDPSKSPRVKFEDEDGIDAGGLRREYFTLLMKEIINNPALFEGREDNKSITYNTSALQSNLYFNAGRIISCAVMHCDIGLPVFSKSMYYFLSHENVDMMEMPHCAEDLPDCSLVQLIRKVESVESPGALENLKEESDLSDLLQAAGWDKLLMFDNRFTAMQLLVAHEAFYKRKLSIDQFCKGLNTLGLLHLIRSHPDLLMPYFVHNADTELTPVLLFHQFYNLENEVDGTRETICKHIKRAISESFDEYGSSKLAEFLMFATGLRALPPLGLDEKITICYRDDGSPHFFAETCTLELKVPTVHDQYSKFYASFLEACMHSEAGFHCS